MARTAPLPPTKAMVGVVVVVVVVVGVVLASRQKAKIGVGGRILGLHVEASESISVGGG